jgi:hypothetical protein
MTHIRRDKARPASLAECLDTDVAAEMALARSDAPAATSRDATVLLAKRSGYEGAQKGQERLCVLSSARG